MTWHHLIIWALISKSLLKELHMLMHTKFKWVVYEMVILIRGIFLSVKSLHIIPILLDFGHTNLLTSSLKQGLAKMFLASVEGDHVALLSALAEMGFRFRMDLSDEAMEEHLKSYKEKTKLKKESLKLSQKESHRFNSVDAFLGDIVIFSRDLNLLERAFIYNEGSHKLCGYHEAVR